jgi:sulfate/thiosulfate transport system permease protein
VSTATATMPGARGRVPLGLGVTTLWLSVIVLIPLAAVAARSVDGNFWAAISNRQAVSAFTFTLWVSLVVAAINAVMGTLIAWVLVRDRFPGRRLVDGLIDLPFALPTIVAGLTLVALYPDLRFTQWSVLLALLFVTLPFVVRAVQPVLLALDREVEEAAASLGASRFTTLRRILLPALAPAITAGAALSFARGISEYGSLVLLSGNLPLKTEVASVRIMSYIENGNEAAAASVATILLVVALAAIVVLQVLSSVVARRG